MPADKPQPCSVCSHESLSAINQAIVNGKSRRGIARTFGIGTTDDEGVFRENHHKITRHITQCMPEQYAEATKGKREDAGRAILSRMDELDEAVNEVLSRARHGEPVLDGDGIPKLNEDGSPKLHYANHLILSAVVQGRQNADLRAKLAGATPEPDSGTMDRQREALRSPEARKLLAQLEELAAKGDQTVQ